MLLMHTINMMCEPVGSSGAGTTRSLFCPKNPTPQRMDQGRLLPPQPCKAYCMLHVGLGLLEAFKQHYSMRAYTLFYSSLIARHKTCHAQRASTAIPANPMITEATLMGASFGFEVPNSWARSSIVPIYMNVPAASACLELER